MPTPRRRRRKPRSRLDVRRYLTPEVLALVAKLVGGGAAVSIPPMLVAQQSSAKVEAAQEQTQYANMNTNAALAIVAVLAPRVDSLVTRVAVLEQSEKESRLRESRTAARLPEAMIGPEVPYTWQVKPPRKPWWKPWG